MARQIEVLSVVQMAKDLCEDPDEALASGSTSYISFLDLEYARLYACYVAAEPDRYRTEATITVPFTPTNVFPLPADWLATIGVDYISSPTVREPLFRLQEQDRNRFNQDGGSSARAYRLIGSNLVLYPPKILAGQQYLHIYLPTAERILSLGQFIDCRLGHEKYLALRLARTMLNIENTYDGRWDTEIDRTEAEQKMEANYRYFNDMARMTSEYSLRRRNWPFNWQNIWPGGRW